MTSAAANWRIRGRLIHAERRQRAGWTRRTGQLWCAVFRPPDRQTDSAYRSHSSGKPGLGAGGGVSKFKEMENRNPLPISCHVDLFLFIVPR